MQKQIQASDPNRIFTEIKSFVPHEKVHELHSTADIFVFASSCENMPNTLIEAMAAGLPIACSNRGPMPEVLQDAGVYFDPEVPSSIAEAIENLLLMKKTTSNWPRKQRSWLIVIHGVVALVKLGTTSKKYIMVMVKRSLP